MGACNWFGIAYIHYASTFRVSGVLQYRISETHIKVKSRKIAFVHNFNDYSMLSCQLDLKFCPERGSDTVVLCEKK